MPANLENSAVATGLENASRRVEEGFSRSFSGGGGKPSFPSPSAGDLRELPRVPLRGEGAEGSGAGGVQTANVSRKQSSLSGKESAQGCLPKRLLGRPD